MIQSFLGRAGALMLLVALAVPLAACIGNDDEDPFEGTAVSYPLASPTGDSHQATIPAIGGDGTTVEVIFNDGSFDQEEVTIYVGDQTFLQIRNLTDQQYLANLGDIVRDQLVQPSTVTRIILNMDEPGTYELHLTAVDSGEVVDTLTVEVGENQGG
jgi:hypothetical protein